MMNFGACAISDGEFDPCSIAKAVGSVFKTAGLSHGGILFEQHGRVAKVGVERYNIPDTLHFSCDRLVYSGRHPAFAAAKSRRTPFDMLALADDYRSDPKFRDFVDAARAHDIRSIFAFPLHDFSGRLFVASGLCVGREMTELELRLTHTFCLDALDSLGGVRDAAAAGAAVIAARARMPDRRRPRRDREGHGAKVRHQSEHGPRAY